MSGNTFSVLGIFDSAQQLMDAIPKVKGKAPGRLEAYTPHPIHGLDTALGFKKSPIGGMVLVMGALGAVAALAFVLWTSGIDYPLITAGKPPLSWEAFIPIVFEVTVLFACFASGLGMLLLLNRLPFFRHPMLRSSAMPLLTRDKYGLAVESGGNELDVDKIASLLGEAGAKTIEVIEAPPPRGPASPRFFVIILAMIGFACMVAGSLAYWSTKLFPTTVPMVHMQDQPRLNSQRSSNYFRDGFGMRRPVPETVLRGVIPYTIRNEDDAGVPANPLPRTESILRRGRHAFEIHCAVCHGILGNGATSLTAAYGAKPANLVSQKILDIPDGKIRHVIIIGKNAMPSYAADLDNDERWATAHYVRVLQRALNAGDEDISK
jgi:mono/diheme cytochrome c family protein